MKDSDDDILCENCGEGRVALRGGAGRVWRAGGVTREIPASIVLPQCERCGELWLEPEHTAAIDAWLASIGAGGAPAVGTIRLLGRSDRRPTDGPALASLDAANPGQRGRVVRLQAKLGAVIGARVVEHVLNDESPHAVLSLRDGHGERFLAVEVDADNRYVRWLHAPITEFEWRGLAWGHVLADELLLDRSAWAVDVDRDGVPVRAWEFREGALPRHLIVPVPIHAPVLERLRDVVPPVALDRTLRLGGKAVRGHEISIDTYATVLRQFQELERAIAFAQERPTTQRARLELTRRSRMNVVAEGPGSLVVHIRASDDATFGKAFAKINAVLNAADSPERLRSEVADVDDAVPAFSALLTTSSMLGVEFVVASGDDVSLVSAARALRYQSSFDAVVRLPPEVRDVVGYFEGFTTGGASPTFRFKSETGEVISGRLSKDLRHLNLALDGIVILGQSQQYRARVRTVRFRRGARSAHERRAEHELIKFTPLRGLLEAAPEAPDEE